MSLKKVEFVERWKQYERLKPVCKIALEQSGIFRTQLEFISDTANIIFKAKTADQDYCIRICQQEWGDSEILGELYWLSDLSQNTNLIVPKPIPSISGDLIQHIALPDSDEQFRIVLFHWIDGEIIGMDATLEMVEQVGQLMGELHNHAASFQPPRPYERERDDWLGMGHLMANMDEGQISKVKALLTPDQIQICDEAAKRAALIINQVDAQQNFGLIHSDLHMENCLLTDDGIGILDFDDCQFAPFTNDLAITISSFDSFDDPEACHDALMHGYSKRRQLAPNYVEEIEAFRIERKLRLIRWISTWPSVDHFNFGRKFIDISLRQFQKYITQ